MEYRDYYKILGVPRTASQAEIKKAFRKLARDHHPDRNAGDKTAEARFKDVNEANAVLGDPEKRKRYDELGADWEAFQRGGGQAADPFGPGGPFAGYASAGGPAGTGRAGNVRYEFRTSGGDAAGFSDFFRTVFGGAAGGQEAGARQAGGRSPGTGTATEPTLEEMLAGMGIGVDQGRVTSTGRARAAGTRQPSAEATAELTLEEAFQGTTRLVEVDGKRLEVTIPRGVDSGSRIRLSGRGPGGGDLLVVTRVKPHKVFQRKGTDLEREIPVTLEEALLGGQVQVATLKGRVLLTIPAGTQSGRVFRLTGQGMPRFRADGAGDLYVRTRVILPTNLDDEATTAARRFLELVDQPDPRASGS